MEQPHQHDIIQWQAAVPTMVPTTVPTINPTARKRRVGKLSPADHLILMGHVCEHRGEYTSGKIVFWKKIGQLFEEDTG